MESTEESIEESIEETYQKISQLDHILLRPDAYIGSLQVRGGRLLYGEINLISS